MPTIILEIKAKPGAKQTSFAVDPHSGLITARIAAQPVDGEANRELVRALSKAIGISAANITVHAGATGRTKLLKVQTTLSKNQIFDRLAAA